MMHLQTVQGLVEKGGDQRGRSDYPNQINNALCFAGFLKGILEARPHGINKKMKLAAARAIASTVRPEDLSEDHIVPNVEDRTVPINVARVVIEASKQNRAKGVSQSSTGA